ncbi:MAG: peptide chain release factor N(5)-glutamine methyltransferase [Bacteroidota bacterium]
MQFPATNRIGDLITFTKSELSSLYDAREAGSIAFLLAGEVLGKSKADLIMQSEDRINQSELLKCMQHLEKLKTGMPVQYVLGYAWFYEMKFIVNAVVLIPRPETEELVKLIINEANHSAKRLLDIGTGSGCIAIALKKNISECKVYASDFSQAALEVAKRNAANNDVVVDFLQADILKNKPDDCGLFDIIVSNPPYIPVSENENMHENVTRYEPDTALFVPDDDPLIFYRAIAEYALKFLTDHGTLYFEIHENFGESCILMLQESGFLRIEMIRDINGKYRIIKACR